MPEPNRAAEIALMATLLAATAPSVHNRVAVICGTAIKDQSLGHTSQAMSGIRALSIQVKPSGLHALLPDALVRSEPSDSNDTTWFL